MCGDDAVGPVVAAEVARSFGEGVQVSYDAAPLWNLAVNGKLDGLVIIIDAAEATPDFPVGSWRRSNIAREAALLSETRLCDTHTLGLEALLTLGGALGACWPRLWIYAVAGCRFEVGDTPSPALLRAMPGLVRQIEADLYAWHGLEPYSSREVIYA